MEEERKYKTTERQRANTRRWKRANREKVRQHHKNHRLLCYEMGICIRCREPAETWPDGTPKSLCAHHAQLNNAKARARIVANPEKYKEIQQRSTAKRRELRQARRAAQQEKENDSTASLQDG